MASPNPLAFEAATAAQEVAASYVTQHKPRKNDNINFANFNQDFSCVSIGYSNGYKIYNCEPFGQCYSKSDGSIGIVEMLFSSSLLAIVGMGEQHSLSPRRLKIINTKRQTTICELTFPGAILAVKLNRERLVVLLEETIYIYDINNMRLLHTIETPPNPNGLIALSPSSDNNYLAYPSPQKLAPNPQTEMASHSNGQTVRNGDVIIFDAKTLQPTSVIEAHRTSLAAIALSKDGLLLATASDKGTIIRVFSVATGIKLYQFRRGTYPTKIYSLAFSPDNRFVIASSATETVHIFRLGEEEAANTIKSANKKARLTKSQAPNPLETSPDIYPHNQHTSSDEDEELNEDEEDLDRDEDDDLEDDAHVPVSLQRGRSSSSTGSFHSSESITDKLKEPLVDNSRKSVARMLRRTSQSLGRKAAEKMGTYLPPKFSSILEPNRHFASLKVPASKETKTVVGVGGKVWDDLIPSVYLKDDANSIPETSEDLVNKKLVHIMVITSEGFFYKFGLDPERGGDCVLLHQQSLFG
ncbi:hypothetical protein KL949_001409 [Ogataea haglerorum]|nr:hypothetical protein KL913_001799 [Ogataea haglerorum]KAG7721677.1 hypothetical protein KL949_001409 [Ogataea haglerorum]KAG7739682.1 hypothetical protein KL923_002529 [Ogataea haglerorum]KAG7759532.1 hypothetical protein KL947_001913 [Ogataea haglerorum]KAG7770005.1 hypothetical protein KL931_002524 [Ogataea haglerorum]